MADLMAEMMAGVCAMGGSTREMRSGTLNGIHQLTSHGVWLDKALTRKRNCEESIGLA